MGWFTPTPKELEYIEQIETIFARQDQTPDIDDTPIMPSINLFEIYIESNKFPRREKHELVAFFSEDPPKNYLDSMWRGLERAHKGKVLQLSSPEGKVIRRPPGLERF